jgi:uncharacterized protein (DUF305 family)
MSKISTALAISLMVVTSVLSAGLLGMPALTDYKASMYDKTAMDLGRPDRTLDLRYINAMIAHHRGAMLLATQASIQTQRQEMKDLSAMILRKMNQKQLMNSMLGKKNGTEIQKSKRSNCFKSWKLR